MLHNVQQAMLPTFPLPPAVDVCFPNPCFHGGACTRLGTTYHCSCTAPWAGTTCSEGVFSPQSLPLPLAMCGISVSLLYFFWQLHINGPCRCIVFLGPLPPIDGLKWPPGGPLGGCLFFLNSLLHHASLCTPLASPWF